MPAWRNSERDRAAIRLRDFEGLSLTETAEAFDSSEAATKPSHFRARKRLASAVRSACGTSGIERRRAGEAVRTSRVSQ